MNMLYGYDVTITPDRPKLRLSDNVLVSDEFRARTNSWLLENFGYSNTVPGSEIYKVGNTLFMNPRTYETVKRATAEYGGIAR